MIHGPFLSHVALLLSHGAFLLLIHRGGMFVVARRVVYLREDDGGVALLTRLDHQEDVTQTSRLFLHRRAQEV